jgi:hypothetical protein
MDGWLKLLLVAGNNHSGNKQREVGERRRGVHMHNSHNEESEKWKKKKKKESPGMRGKGITALIPTLRGYPVAVDFKTREKKRKITYHTTPNAPYPIGRSGTAVVTFTLAELE